LVTKVFAMGIWLSKLWRLISRQRWEIRTWRQWMTNRKRPSVVPMVTSTMTSRDPKGSRSWPQNIWCSISRQRCKIETWCQPMTNRKWPTAVPMVTWPTDDVTWPERVKVVTPKCLRLIILAVVQDRDIVSTDDQYERTICSSNCHVIDDIKWP